MTPSQIAIQQLRAARHYTKLVLDHTPHALWFTCPANVSTHVAWQVGHITWTNTLHGYRTVAGRNPDEVIDPSYSELFGKDSVAVEDAARYPTPDEIVAVMDHTLERTVATLEALPEAVFDEPATHSTGMVNTKLELLLYLARHEVLHVGQIGLIRRLLGEKPYR